MFVRRTLALLAGVPVAVALIGCSSSPAEKAAEAPAATASAPAALTGDAQIERGRMLVIGGGCHDCHTPKKFGQARQASATRSAGRAGALRRTVRTRRGTRRASR